MLFRLTTIFDLERRAESQGTLWTKETFKRFRLVAKSSYWFRHVCLSACISATFTGCISVKFNVIEKLQIRVKSDKNIGRFTYRSRNFYCCRRCTVTIKTLLSNTPYFYIVDSDMHLNNTHKIFHCNNGYAGTPRCCAIPTLPVLFKS